MGKKRGKGKNIPSQQLFNKFKEGLPQVIFKSLFLLCSTGREELGSFVLKLTAVF